MSISLEELYLVRAEQEPFYRILGGSDKKNEALWIEMENGTNILRSTFPQMKS